MTHCGCSPTVHSLCLAEWYTGTGADGRDICPCCRTNGRIRGIGEILQRIAFSRSSENVEASAVTLTPMEMTEYQTLASTEPAAAVTVAPAAAPVIRQQRSERNDATNGPPQEDEQARNQRKLAAFCLSIILILVFIYGIMNLQ